MSQRSTGLRSDRVQKSQGKQELALSPINHNRRASLLEEYEKKVGDVMQSSNLTFQKIQTPGWSSLVESDISEKKEVRKEDILGKLVSLNNKTYEEVNRNKPLRQPDNALRSASNLPRATQPSRVKENGNVATLPNRPKVYIVERSNTIRPLNGAEATSANPSKQQPRSSTSKPSSKKPQKRWRQIDVYEHLYLDSKKLQTKRMVEKIMDEEMRNELFTFHPTISQNSIMLAEQRQKKLQVDPYYRCVTRSQAKLPAKKPVVDPSEQEFKCLHALFYILSNGTMTLDRDSLNAEQVPMPCLRSLEPLLEMIYTDRKLSWPEFLEEFYDKAVSRKAFFHVLSEWIRRNEIDVDL